ncbi:MAG: DUF427 domain-containing protein [Planctomycetota bacterium]
MARAVFHGTVIAESDDVVELEGNLYFPMSSLNRDAIEPSDVTSTCPYKGEAKYYDVVVGDERAEYAVWYYPEPKDGVSQIRDRAAFWRGVEVEH